MHFTPPTIVAALLASTTVLFGSSPATAAVQPVTQTSVGATTHASELARVLADLKKLGRAATAAEAASRTAARRATRASRAEQVAAAARDDAATQAREAAHAAALARARASSAAAQLARSGGPSQDAAALLLQGTGARETLWGLSRMSELSANSTQLFSQAATAKAAADATAAMSARGALQAADHAKEARATAVTAKKRYLAVTNLIARQRVSIQALSTRAQHLTGEIGLPAAEASPARGAWTAPVHGILLDRFGPRPDAPVAGVSPFHRGQDIAAPCGTPIRAAASGTVLQAGYNGSYGNWVLLDSGNGIQTGYAHSAQLLVSPGQHVTAGRPIATVGSTGASTGCHLHFEVHIEGVAVDPVPFMTGRTASLTRS